MAEMEPTIAGLAALTDEVRRPGGGDATVARAFNAALASALRAGNGELTGELAGRKLLILTTTGRRTGNPISVVLRYTAVQGRLFVVASMGGAKQNPQWYLNLAAAPRARVELGGKTFAVDAVVLNGDERDRVFATAAQTVPMYLEYQARTARRIPVIELVRVG